MKRLILIALLTAVVAAPAQAFPGRGGPKGGPDGGPMGQFMAIVHHLERVGDEIGLSDDQREAIDAAVDETRVPLREIRRAVRANHRDLREQLAAGGYDAAAVQALADEQGQLVSQGIVLGAQLAHRVHEVLTDAQREQLRAMRAEHRRGR